MLFDPTYVSNEGPAIFLAICELVGCLEVQRSSDFARIHPDLVNITQRIFPSVNRHELVQPCVRNCSFLNYRIPVFLLRLSYDPKRGTVIFFRCRWHVNYVFLSTWNGNDRELGEIFRPVSFSEFSVSWCSRTFFSALSSANRARFSRIRHLYKYINARYNSLSALPGLS